jgi:hypothetical protein
MNTILKINCRPYVKAAVAALKYVDPVHGSLCVMASAASTRSFDSLALAQDIRLAFPQVRERVRSPTPCRMACHERAKRVEWSRRDSNPRHLACKASALPTELRPRGGEERGQRSEVREAAAFQRLSDLSPPTSHLSLVGAPRLELGTSALSGPRSNQLSYAPGPLKLTILE